MKPVSFTDRRPNRHLRFLPFLLFWGIVSLAVTGWPADLTTAIIKIAKETIPAVVHIEITESKQASNPFLPFQGSPFRRYFGDPKEAPKFKREVKGLGTGMLIDSQGHILTNHHVAGGATKVEVLLSDGQRYTAKLIGSDPKTDLAVIKISAKGTLPYVKFGNSDKVEVGQWVIAIGHPRGLDQTVTQGIISAKHRRGVTDPSSYEDFLQTDAAINPGNSGGPLLNLDGEVIGVNAAIASESGGFEGIGFTIPSNMAVHVFRELMAHGKVERGWLGVSIQDLSSELVKKLGLDSSKGAIVMEVVKGGPADKAGIQKDDVITAFQNNQVADSNELRDQVANSKIGQEARLTLVRGKKKQNLNVKIESQEMATKLLTASAKDRLGAEVRAPDAKEIEKYGIEANQGVVITDLQAKSPLKEAGFEVGDLIIGMNGQPVEGVEGFVTLVSSLPADRSVSFFVLDHRTGKTGAVDVTLR
jgi:serine protease Do